MGPTSLDVYGLALADIAWSKLLWDLLRMLAAFALAMPIGWERQQNRALGLRTFPLVAIASCGYVLVGVSVIGDGGSPAEGEAIARLIQGLMTGIGFIGGGAILKHHGDVRGTATAASIWATGAIGAAVALDRYSVAIVISLVTFLTLEFLTPISKRGKHALGEEVPSSDPAEQ